ncbi:FAD-binding oxidoreductase, partial [Bordetella hinzii]|nr:FAD-binding oxidoreductase [Bordetella hinzii]
MPASGGASAEADVIVAGAGMVGAAIAYGLAGLGQRVLLVDGGDTDYRAAKANFGLVWLQGKGHGNPDYQRLSHRSVLDWPDFARELQAESGID